MGQKEFPNHKINLPREIRDIGIMRSNIVQICFVIFAFILIEKLFIILLKYNYGLTGSYGMYVSVLFWLITFNFFYLIYQFVEKIGTSTALSIKNLYEEWMSLSILNKLLAISGLLSLPNTLAPLIKHIFIFLDTNLEFIVNLIHYRQ